MVAPPRDIEPVEVAFGRFAVLGRIRTRAETETFLARAEDGLVELEVLRRELSGVPARVEAFERASLAAAAAPHPAWAGWPEQGRVGAVPYRARPRVGGVSLARWLRGGSAEAGLVGPVVAELAEAVAAAHAAGQLHGALVADAVRLSADGGIALLGLEDVVVGQRRGAGEDPAALRARGPEGARGAPLGAATDVFALAVLLAELLAGRPPFDGDASEVRAALVAARRAPELPGLRAPDALVAWIAAGLDPEPTARPSAERWAAGLRERLRMGAAEPEGGPGLAVALADRCGAELETERAAVAALIAGVEDAEARVRLGVAAVPPGGLIDAAATAFPDAAAWEVATELAHDERDTLLPPPAAPAPLASAPSAAPAPPASAARRAGPLPLWGVLALFGGGVLAGLAAGALAVWSLAR